MNNDKETQQPRPFSVRLTPDERTALTLAAGRMPIGSYIRSRLFENGEPPRRRRQVSPIKDHEALAKVLAELGRSRLASNVNQLAKLANCGALPVTPDIETALRQASADISLMRAQLLQALGQMPSGSS